MMILTHRDDCHEGSSVRKYWQPVKDPLEDIGNVNQSGAVKLVPEISEEKNSCRRYAACQNVDNDQKREPGGCIVEEETEGIGKGYSENTKKDDDESECSPAMMEKKGFFVIQTEDEGVHDECGGEVHSQVPDEVGQPKHTLS